MIIIKLMGGLGNQLFQYALFISLKNKYPNESVFFDKFFYTNVSDHNGFELDRVLKNFQPSFADQEKIDILADLKLDFFNKVRRKLWGIKKTHYIETKFGYNQCVFEFNTDMYLEGYWQSVKYFSSVSDLIRKEIEFKKITEVKNLEISNLINKNTSVSIHVRRGDYVNHPLYEGICTINYYNRAIKQIKKKIDNLFFFVFSNDIEWCKKNLDIKENIYYIDWNTGEDSYRDMQLMSLCKHNIIANSSFSWWGAWLNNNPDKIIIAPKKWLNDVNDTSDLIPEEWIKL